MLEGALLGVVGVEKTIVVVTHDARVAHFAHRILEIRDGKIVTEPPTAAQ